MHGRTATPLATVERRGGTFRLGPRPARDPTGIVTGVDPAAVETAALNSTTYGWSNDAWNVNAFLARNPEVSSYSKVRVAASADNCSPSVEGRNNASASRAVSAGSPGTTSVKGSDWPDSTCGGTRSTGRSVSSRYCFNCQLTSAAPRFVNVARTRSLSTTISCGPASETSGSKLSGSIAARGAAGMSGSGARPAGGDDVGADPWFDAPV